MSKSKGLSACPACGGAVRRQISEHREVFGPYTVIDKSQRIATCTKCGETFVSLAEKHRFELRAAQVVLHDVAKVPGEVIRGVRKALGLKQGELAGLLDVRVETLSRYETDDAEVPRAVQLAVADLCARAELSDGSVDALKPKKTTSKTLRVA